LVRWGLLSAVIPMVRLSEMCLPGDTPVFTVYKACKQRLAYIYQMDRKMDSILRILMEQFPPKPDLTSKPSIRRVTIQKRMGASIDEVP
ncbi:hypothetical protein GOODEAATRI_001319, partial [Goodea atripinnis]